VYRLVRERFENLGSEKGTLHYFHVSHSIRLTFTHTGVPMVNGLGVMFVLSRGNLNWNDKELKMLDGITCGPKVDPGGYRWPPTFSNWPKTCFWQFW
jgi:hypothetical protein